MGSVSHSKIIIHSDIWWYMLLGASRDSIPVIHYLLQANYADVILLFKREVSDVFCGIYFIRTLISRDQHRSLREAFACCLIQALSELEEGIDVVSAYRQMQPSLGGWEGEQCSQASPVMVSLAVLAALSRANGGGYDTFLNFCAYFWVSRSVDVVRRLLCLADILQSSRMWSGSEALGASSWSEIHALKMPCWNKVSVNELFKEKFVC